ncbi:ribbon-helix-helix domain-containing protein [Fumia xinanensis]|uniref:CopG family transcriptional regulator n=1 Tax=Fumia xinanensis TaxID=2763659 RepID=A0A926E529_9FIRM|nr:ribbon-helix-helix domain-containing protein [Fumia xinanensis]MBC8559713.1 CopG family transcriptional regulator [Fumia xinanensis]
MPGKKMGRPTDNPMPIRVGFRLDPKTLSLLDEYCKKNNIRRSDVIRQAIIQYISE